MRLLPRRRALPLVLALLVGAAAVPAALAAQRPQSAPVRGSQYLPLDDPAYRYVDGLLARGALAELSALERPYTVAQLRAALDELSPAALRDVPGAWAARLRVALDRIDPRDPDTDDDRPSLRLALFAVGTAESSARRELMRADDSSGVHPGIGGRATLATGPVVAAVRLLGDRRLKEDPDFAGTKTRGIAGRTEEAYIAGQWRYGSIFLGRTTRNWGPWALDGLQLGSYAYSWDHVAGSLGTDRLRLTSIVARLDRYRAQPDTLFERHLAMHRLSARLGGFELGLTETVVYGGAGRGAELSLVNPLSLYQLAQYNEAGDGNVSYSADLAVRIDRLGTFAGQLLVDDLQIDRCSPNCEEPASLGWTLSAEGLPLAGAQRLFASYTRVSNLTYRSPQPWERWATFDVGIGRGFSDYDETRVGLDLALFAAAPVRAYAAYRRQGEGDYRLAFPAPEQYAETPAFLAGRPERTWRLAVAGGAVVGPLDVAADVGYNRVSDADHVRGRSRTGVEGRVRATLQLVSPPLRP